MSRKVVALAIMAAVLSGACAGRSAETPGPRPRPKPKAGAEPEENPVSQLIRDALDPRSPTRVRDDAIRRLQGQDRETLREFRVPALLRKISADRNDAPRVRRTALKALAYLARNTDPSMKESVLETLVGILKAARELTSLRVVAAREAAPLVEPGGFGFHREALTALERIAQGRDALWLRVTAIRALGEIRAESSRAILRKLIRNAHKTVREEALKALGRLGSPQKPDPGFARYLLRVLGDASSPAEERRAVMFILARMPHRPALEHIETILGSLDPKTREERKFAVDVVRAINIFRDPASAKTLTAAYRRFDAPEHARVRAAVCDALGDLYLPLARSRAAGVSGAAAAVTQCLVDVLYDEESAEVIVVALYALMNLEQSPAFPRRSVIEAVVEALGDKDESVRARCEETLEILTGHSISHDEGETVQDYQHRWQQWWVRNRGRFPK